MFYLCCMYFFSRLTCSRISRKIVQQLSAYQRRIFNFGALCYFNFGALCYFNFGALCYFNFGALCYFNLGALCYFNFGALCYFNLGALLEGLRRLLSYKLALQYMCSVAYAENFHGGGFIQ